MGGGGELAMFLKGPSPHRHGPARPAGACLPTITTYTYFIHIYIFSSFFLPSFPAPPERVWAGPGDALCGVGGGGGAGTDLYRGKGTKGKSFPPLFAGSVFVGADGRSGTGRPPPLHSSPVRQITI